MDPDGAVLVTKGASGGEFLRCSFCDKTKQEVRKLIAGPTVFICDECVTLCVDILTGDPERQDMPQDSAERQRWRSRAARLEKSTTCSLCGAPAAAHEMLSIEGRGMICGGCADAVEDALARGRLIE